MELHPYVILSSCWVLFISIIVLLVEKMAVASISSPAVWADQPLPLINVTELQGDSKDDLFTLGAVHMALVHNVVLRGFNSIYLQAEKVKREDFSDFVGYAGAWCRFVKMHHDDEEKELFKKLEEVVGESGIMDSSIQEHAAFLQGVNDMTSYLATLDSPQEFSGARLVELLDSFKGPFSAHWGINGEVAHIKVISLAHPELVAKPEIRQVFATWGRASLMKTGVTDGVAFFLHNLDVGSEDGKWRDWPRIPGPIRWGLSTIGGSWNAGWWRFASCTKDGHKKELEVFKNE